MESHFAGGYWKIENCLGHYIFLKETPWLANFAPGIVFNGLVALGFC